MRYFVFHTNATFHTCCHDVFFKFIFYDHMWYDSWGTWHGISEIWRRPRLDQLINRHVWHVVWPDFCIINRHRDPISFALDAKSIWFWTWNSKSTICQDVIFFDIFTRTNISYSVFKLINNINYFELHYWQYLLLFLPRFHCHWIVDNNLQTKVGDRCGYFANQYDVHLIRVPPWWIGTTTDGLPFYLITNASLF